MLIRTIENLFIESLLFDDVNRMHNKEPEELIKAKQGCVATQQHLLFFASLATSSTNVFIALAFGS